MRELRPFLFISADAQLRKQFLVALLHRDIEIEVPMAATLNEGRAHLRQGSFKAILLDASVLGKHSLDPVVREFARVAPVLLLTARGPFEDGLRLQDLIVANKVEILTASADGASVLTAAVERRLRLRAQAAEIPEEVLEDFGEVLRHEINNPLTGILGNAELLLARREGLPALAVQRLETIAELAVRLRETIRRLSNSWEGRRQHARSA